MSRMTRFSILASAAAVVVASVALAAVPGKTTEVEVEPAVDRAQPLRVRPSHLLQHDGAELYRELCASCHGVDADGNGPAATTVPVPTPPLTHLKRAGVSKRHWTYVIQAGCEDSHHWAPDGSETMPCWQRIFRQSLGDDAGALLVSAKLADYLESIQR